ncbi:MAG: hypothetical protein WA724_03575 [Candidatus Dormiibacterota bacterium]
MSTSARSPRDAMSHQDEDDDNNDRKQNQRIKAYSTIAWPSSTCLRGEAATMRQLRSRR